MKRLSLQFRLCNMIFGDALRQAIVFGTIKLNNILKFNICESRLDLMDYEGICAIFNELPRVVYGIESRSLYFNEEGLIVNKMTFRFKICNLIYFGSLSSEMDSAIRLLYALTSYLNSTDLMYDETCSDVIRCIIHIFDKIMY